ncbi:MAG: NYN domain-containing protein [Candidatus Sungbacteria bacterium]|nr:NYN domain-containing protein [Candidatus Sungbacteria bacterium]
MAKFVCVDCKENNSIPREQAVFKCIRCTKETIMHSQSSSHPKANFDVELTVDALDYARPNTEIMIFSGDGDFRYLAEKLIARGAIVLFISSTQNNYAINKRVSTRLKNLVAEEEKRARDLGQKPRVQFLEINNWRNLIQKEKLSENEENAAKRDVSE